MQELPSFSDLVQEFGLYLTSELHCDAQIDTSGTVSCACGPCTRWKAYLRNTLPGSHFRQYEVFTRDHILGLAKYLRERADCLSQPTVRVLEVGGGDGRLSAYLQKELENLSAGSGPTVLLTCTDSGQDGLHVRSCHRVLLQDCKSALREHSPHIIISCWQPMGVDWSRAFRETQTVVEYILIGETDEGICGHPWLTWGCADDGDGSDASEDDSGNCSSYGGTQPKPPYAKDGFARVDLECLSAFQICQTDERWSPQQHSHTVAFRRLVLPRHC